MKVTVLAAISLDGYIAKGPAEHIDWTSPEDKAQLKERTLAAGVVIMGYNTFKLFKNLDDPMPGRLVVVMIPHTEDTTDSEQVLYRSGEPQKVWDELAERGYKEAILFGGSMANASFLEVGLVDEMWITVTPHLFGAGIPLFASNLAAELELIESGPLGPGEILNHYKVVK